MIGAGSGLLTFSITWQPSFEPNAGFALLTRPERSAAPTRRVCRVIWDAAHDFSRLAEMPIAAVRLRPPEPTLHVAAVDAPPEAGEWAEEAAALRFPPVIARDGGGLDGSLTTVRFGEALQYSEFRWWCDGPSEWAPLVAWTARTRARFEQMFSES